MLHAFRSIPIWVARMSQKVRDRLCYRVPGHALQGVSPVAGHAKPAWASTVFEVWGHLRDWRKSYGHRDRSRRDGGRRHLSVSPCSEQRADGPPHTAEAKRLLCSAASAGPLVASPSLGGAHAHTGDTTVSGVLLLRDLCPMPLFPSTRDARGACANELKTPHDERGAAL